jgi:hypothetical protein
MTETKPPNLRFADCCATCQHCEEAQSGMRNECKKYGKTWVADYEVCDGYKIMEIEVSE